jgi:hypothetical protein
MENSGLGQIGGHTVSMVSLYLARLRLIVQV